MTVNQINSIYNDVKEHHLSGRYITNSSVEDCLSKLPTEQVLNLGSSVEKRSISGVKFGQGSKRILLWSQMHGNESTTTKALFDLFNFFTSQNKTAKSILNSTHILFVPILNPDGAEGYTRLNANGIDLNRDAQNLSQPESRILKKAFDSFRPHYCFNLHGQRTIFGAGTEGNVATLSFLAPAQDANASLTENRKLAMSLISYLYDALGPYLPNGIGRYDDSFNLNCVGDTFQNYGVPTVLFEAGHYPNDYLREEVRRYTFLAILLGLSKIAGGVNINSYKGYFDIPENTKSFRDLIIKNARISEEDSKTYQVVFQYTEVLQDNLVAFKPIVEEISNLSSFSFHRTIDAEGQLVKTHNNSKIFVGYENDFVLIKSKKIALKP